MFNLPEKFLKPYNPMETESAIYEKWLRSNFFNPDECIKKGVAAKDAETFSIMLPPPNVTGTLHIGHAAMLAIEDTVVRYHRMKGDRTLWLPGTDHAAIATQTRVEKLLSKKKQNRHDMGREKFLEEVDKFAKESHDTIENQIKVMGSSVDWSREAFTLDKKRQKSVFHAFEKMYEDGLISRGHRIVNWDPKGQTVISDDEVVRVEEKTKLYYLKYGPFTIATARPETKFGDKYVVMHPDDKRYAEYEHGQGIELEWINGPIKATIIKDDVIDMEFGTGVMTITPWHDVTDFEIAGRHDLDKEQIIDEYGKLLPIAGEFEGMKIAAARGKIIEKLESKGLVEKVEENYEHVVATAERTGAMIEPQIKLQWFVSVNKEFDHFGNKTTLKTLMREAVDGGDITILPERFEKVYFNWINNLHDWCISRQIWYGHQIPAWYRVDTDGKRIVDEEGNEEIHIGEKKPIGKGWERDSDTLDTWFSSGLWTFSPLGWPEKTKDFETYHPTDLLETGYDILFFWVARMILMSKYFLNEAPFKHVYLHGLVRDAQGRKMSKSLGNAIDPVEFSEKYGADAVRMSLIIGIGPGNDTNLSEDKVRAYKKFTNKIWNASRFVLENINDLDLKELKDDELHADDQKQIEKVEALGKDISDDIENYRLYLAGEKLYHSFWHDFADIVIEESKKNMDGERRVSTQKMLYKSLVMYLKLLHPFIPFVTEEIWEQLPVKDSKLLLVSQWNF